MFDIIYKLRVIRGLLKDEGYILYFLFRDFRLNGDVLWSSVLILVGILFCNIVVFLYLNIYSNVL